MIPWFPGFPRLVVITILLRLAGALLLLLMLRLLATLLSLALRFGFPVLLLVAVTLFRTVVAICFPGLLLLRWFLSAGLALALLLLLLWFLLLLLLLILLLALVGCFFQAAQAYLSYHIGKAQVCFLGFAYHYFHGFQLLRFNTLFIQLAYFFYAANG